MKTGVSKYTKQEQELREVLTAKRAEFTFRQKVERQRWEQEVLAPFAAECEKRLARGESIRLELSDGS
jgi:hypothetical protein